MDTPKIREIPGRRIPEIREEKTAQKKLERNSFHMRSIEREDEHWERSWLIFKKAHPAGFLGKLSGHPEVITQTFPPY